jgi:hypothetical protein
MTLSEWNAASPAQRLEWLRMNVVITVEEASKIIATAEIRRTKKESTS